MIAAGTELRPGQEIRTTGGFVFAYQGDGNVVLYRYGQPIWAWDTLGLPPGVVAFQGDGNLVYYGPDGSPLKDTHSFGTQPRLRWTRDRIWIEAFGEVWGAATQPSDDPAFVHASPIVGQLRVADRAFVDDTGPRLPVMLHAGDLIGQGLLFGAEHIRPIVESAARAGYHGIRSWWQLHTERGGWWDQWPAPRWDPRADPIRFQEVLALAASYGLTWHVSAGALRGVSNRDEDALFDCLADAIGVVGPEHFALVEGGNEIINTGDPDDTSPDELWRLVSRVRRRFPQILYALTSSVDESREALRKYLPPGGQFFYVHGDRGGLANDMIRHVFSLGYRGESLPPTWLGWQGEPFGVGPLVSAMTSSGKASLNAHTMTVGGCMAAMARQAWTFMSSPGVVCSEGRFEAQPGYFDVPATVAQLPADLMRFDVLNHSGPSKRGLRIHAVIDASPHVRADYAIDSATGRFVEIVYGPPNESKDLPEERRIAESRVITEGPWARVTSGRLA